MKFMDFPDKESREYRINPGNKRRPLLGFAVSPLSGGMPEGQGGIGANLWRKSLKVSPPNPPKGGLKGDKFKVLKSPYGGFRGRF